jgi:hypothetical protein
VLSHSQKSSRNGETLKNVPLILEQIKSLGYLYFISVFILNIFIIRTKQIPWAENNTASLREIKENLNKWRHLPWSWTRKLKIVKVSVLFKLNAGKPVRTQDQRKWVKESIRATKTSLEKIEMHC